MLDYQNLSYMQVGREALGLSLSFGRLASGRTREQDIAVIGRALEHFERALSQDISMARAEPDGLLFATA